MARKSSYKMFYRFWILFKKMLRIKSTQIELEFCALSEYMFTVFFGFTLGWIWAIFSRAPKMMFVQSKIDVFPQNLACIIEIVKHFQLQIIEEHSILYNTRNFKFLRSYALFHKSYFPCKVPLIEKSDFSKTNFFKAKYFKSSGKDKLENR